MVWLPTTSGEGIIFDCCLNKLAQTLHFKKPPVYYLIVAVNQTSSGLSRSCLEPEKQRLGVCRAVPLSGGSRKEYTSLLI